MTGYQSKKAAAQSTDEVNWSDHEPNGLAQPAQEPVALVIDGVLVKSALPEKYTGHLYTTPQRTEQNFCPRCGKRTNDIHTCTPPSQEKNT